MNSDFVEIVASFAVMTQPMYRCDECLRSKSDRHRERMGCTGQARPKQLYRPDSGIGQKIEFDSCMANYSSNEWMETLNFLPSFRQGKLMFSGSYSEQPAKFVSAMNLIDNLMREDEERRARIIKGLKRGK